MPVFFCLGPMEDTPEFVTGIFVRVERNGKWQAIDIALCEPEELSGIFERKSPMELRAWLFSLLGWIRGSHDAEKMIFRGKNDNTPNE